MHSTFNTLPPGTQVFLSNWIQTTALTCTHEGPKTHHSHTGPPLTETTAAVCCVYRACSRALARKESVIARVETVCWWLTHFGEALDGGPTDKDKFGGCGQCSERQNLLRVPGYYPGKCRALAAVGPLLIESFFAFFKLFLVFWAFSSFYFSKKVKEFAVPLSYLYIRVSGGVCASFRT